MIKHRGLLVFEDVRKAIVKLSDNKSKYFHDFCIKLHPTQRKFVTVDKTETVNLQELNCTCQEYKENIPLSMNRNSINRMCKHLLRTILNQMKIDSLSRLLLENKIKFGNENIIKKEIAGKSVFFGIRNINQIEWIAVYAPNSSVDDCYINYSYNISQNRWSYGIAPEDKHKYEDLIGNIIRSLKR